MVTAGPINLDTGFRLPAGSTQPPGARLDVQENPSGDAQMERACQEFEAIFLTHLLKAMRSSTAALGAGEEEAGAGIMNELMDEHLARAIAKEGGLGLTRLLRGTFQDTGGEGSVSAGGRIPIPSTRLPVRQWIVEGPPSTAEDDTLTRVSHYDSIIGKAAEKYNLSPGLLKAVITQESGGRADAVSPKGAKGLMQLMDETARDMDVGDPFDPEENIFGGARYLRRLLDRWGGNLKMALAAYNAGPSAVDRHGGLPPYTETRDYVQRVLATLRGLASSTSW